MRYQLGCQLLSSHGSALPAGVDAAARCGHLMRLCLEHAQLNRAAGAASVDALTRAAASARAGVRAVAEAGGDDGYVDMQAPAVAEVSLMQVCFSVIAHCCVVYHVLVAIPFAVVRFLAATKRVRNERVPCALPVSHGSRPALPCLTPIIPAYTFLLLDAR